MPLVQAKADGTVFRVTLEHQDDKYRGKAPLEVEVGNGNEALLAVIGANPSAYRIENSQVTIGGQPVAFTADSDQYAVSRLLRSLAPSDVSALRAGARGFVLAMKNGQTPTAQQRDRALAWAILKILIGD